MKTHSPVIYKISITGAIIASSFFPLSVSATDAGPNFPGTVVSDASNGGSYAWSNPGNAQSNDGVCAVSFADGRGTQYLKATNFGFSIPAGSTIDGIRVYVERRRLVPCVNNGDGGSCNINDLTISLIYGTGPTFSSNNPSATSWPGIPGCNGTVETYGSTSNLWGLSLLPSDISDVNFGIVIAAVNDASLVDGTNVNIDYVSITVTYSVVTPVNFLYFNAKAFPDENKVMLNWSTTSEVNSDYFSIFRSTDNNSWRSVGVIKAAGNSSEVIQYNWVDKTPEHGTSYYILKETDFDGKTQVIGPVAIRLETRTAERLRVFPNPFSGRLLNIDVTEFDNSTELLVVLYNQIGIETYSKTFSIPHGCNCSSTLDLAEAVPPSGVYYVSVSGSGKQYHQKLIIQ